MTRRLVQSFRGLRAVLLQTGDSDRNLLADTLVRLGLKVSAVNFSDGEETSLEVLGNADIFFFDADIADCTSFLRNLTPAAPIVAIIGLETPTTLQRAFELGPAAVLYKPLRSSGIYSALFFATNEHRRRADLLDRLRILEERHNARRFVQKAILRLMDRHKCDDEEAFKLLRRESMRQRITVEELSMRVLAATPPRAARKA